MNFAFHYLPHVDSFRQLGFEIFQRGLLLYSCDVHFSEHLFSEYHSPNRALFRFPSAGISHSAGFNSSNTVTEQYSVFSLGVLAS